MRRGVVAGGLLHLVEASLLATQEEQQERQVEERQRRERRLADLVRRQGPLLGHVVTPFEQGAHRRPQRRPPQVAGARSGSASRRNARISASIAAISPAARRSKTRARCAVSNARHRSRRAGPLEQLRRLVELLVEAGLADDERVVNDRGRRTERADVIEAARPIERRRRRRSRARDGSSEKYSSAASRASSCTAITESRDGCAAMARSRSIAVTASSVR